MQSLAICGADRGPKGVERYLVSPKASPSVSFSVQDGERLHKVVPPERWCVQQTDLKDLRRLIHQYVISGKVKPHERDNFDPFDNIIGPSIYTVIDQLIKPVTARAGNMSWALMLHPQGLLCDLFVTHAWQEGCFEFIDKVLYSWPTFAWHAYICFLSNPQNLSVESLISTPRHSAFAMALRSAAYMMVVPNNKGSIYRRIWCCYEAFLAHSLEKIIYIAAAPIKGLRLTLLHVPTISIISGSITFVVFAVFLDDMKESEIFAHRSSDVEAEVFERPLLLVYAICLLLCLLRALTTASSQVGNFLGGLLSGIYTGYVAQHLMLGSTEQKSSFAVQCDVSALLHGPALTAFFAAAEADRRYSHEYQRNSVQLRSYTMLRDSESFSPADKETILEELTASDQEEAVEAAVQLLILTGMSSPSLQRVAAHVSDWTQAGPGQYCLCHVVLGFYFWVGYSGWTIWTDICSLPWMAHLCLFEGLIWLLIFPCLHLDYRAFAATAMVRIIVFGWTIIYLSMGFRKAVMNLPRDESKKVEMCLQVSVSAGILGPTVLCLSIIGPGGVVRINYLGPFLLRLLSMGWCLSIHGLRRLWHSSTKDRFENPVDVPSQEPSAVSFSAPQIIGEFAGTQDTHSSSTRISEPSETLHVCTI